MLLRSLRDTIEDVLFDFLHNTETSKKVETYHLEMSALSHAKRYQATLPNRFSLAMRMIPAAARRGSFVDFGCGKGRTLILAEKAGFRQIYGIEGDARLAALARRNLHKASVTCAEVIHQDVCDFAIPSDSTLFYLYNPFDEVMLEKVLGNIVESIGRNPREACLVYVTPVHEALLYPGRFSKIYEKRGLPSQDVAVYQIRSENVLAFDSLLKRAMA